MSWFHEQGTPTRSSQQAVVDPQAFFLPTGEAGVRIWIMLKLPALVRLFFAVERPDGAEAHYLARDVALDAGLDEIALEQVAQVVNLSATALWAGNLESSRQELEKRLGVGAPAQPDRELQPDRPRMLEHRETIPGAPAREPAPERRASAAVGLEYTARLAGPEGLYHGPGLDFALVAKQRRLELGGRGHAQWLIPREVENSGVTLELRGAALGLGAFVARQLSDHVWATGELGAGFDLVEYRALSLGDPSLEPTATSSEIRPLSYARAGLRAGLGVVSVSCALLLAVQFLSTHYDAADAGQRSELLRPWLVQPGLAAGVAW